MITLSVDPTVSPEPNLALPPGHRPGLPNTQVPAPLQAAEVLEAQAEARDWTTRQRFASHVCMAGYLRFLARCLSHILLTDECPERADLFHNEVSHAVGRVFLLEGKVERLESALNNPPRLTTSQRGSSAGSCHTERLDVSFLSSCLQRTMGAPKLLDILFVSPGQT